MAFFEQIGKHLTDAGQNVSQQTKNLAELTRLNSTISEKEKKISELYRKVGQDYYERHKNDEASEGRALLDEISVLQNEVLQCREKVKLIKGMAKCPVCGEMINANHLFCTHCGAKIEDSKE